MKKIQSFLQTFKEKYKEYKRNRSNSRRFKAFYYSSKEDKRSDVAKIIDYVLIRIIIFFAVLLSVYLRGFTLYISVLASAMALTMYHIISIPIRNKRLMGYKKEKRKIIAHQRVYKEILNKTEEEMKEYMTKVFEKVGFANIQSIDNHHKSILLQASHNDNNILIGCYVYKNDFDVELKELKEFVCQLTAYDIKKGIIVTTSDFTHDCNVFIEHLSENYRLLLLNKDKLLNIIETTEMLPPEEEIDEAIENQISKKKKNWSRYKTAALSSKKIKGYFLLTIYLSIAAFYTPYTVYYMIFAGITMFLALTTFIIDYNNKRKIQEDKIEVQDLFQSL
ncbi:Restriction endonuclease [Natronincola peptidivorans]|uniref:Restriction endonuclease n=1 Tax=Natronincola peptidivorans TaxID=426128 RepID=A0A1H9Y6A7_9FIRM|nr:restriction endonuclease [Natronincola peptidivorans]SES64343.1 Restriction endonuclease [Natronincola peptidivorans]